MWRGSFHDTLMILRGQGVDAGQLRHLLRDMCYLPVITAHPSEARRRTIKGALRGIFLSIEALDDPRMVGMYRAEAMQQLSNQIHVLWNTDEVSDNKLVVRDEIRAGLSYFPLSLFQAVTQVYRNFDRSLLDVYGGDMNPRAPSFLRFGSWIGGDRDGHPLVTTEVTALAWRMQAQTICLEYLRRVEALSDQLSYSIKLCRPSAAFMDNLEADQRQAEALYGARANRYLQEPYRRKHVHHAPPVAARSGAYRTRAGGARQSLRAARLCQRSGLARITWASWTRSRAPVSGTTARSRNRRQASSITFTKPRRYVKSA